MGMAVKWRATGAGVHRFLRGLDPPRRRRALGALGSLAYPARSGGLSCSPPGGFEPAAGGRGRGTVADLGLDGDDVAQDGSSGRVKSGADVRDAILKVIHTDICLKSWEN